jgi:hypothetical protein
MGTHADGRRRQSQRSYRPASAAKHQPTITIIHHEVLTMQYYAELLPLHQQTLLTTVTLTTHLQLVPRLRMSGAIPPLPQYVFMTWCLLKHRDSFNLTFSCEKFHKVTKDEHQGATLLAAITTLVLLVRRSHQTDSHISWYELLKQRTRRKVLRTTVHRPP